MLNIFKKFIATILTIVFIIGPFATSAIAAAEEPEEDANAGAMAIDFLLVRPLGIVTTIVGGVVFAFSFPFSAVGGNSRDAFNQLVAAPAQFTFKRPLGSF
ncbi:MAG: hypothetical protein HQK79_01860 [Desulfobacterales bacterium]|nr:hypothetical protein [Desulfobacterales bacterium]MBF0397316.1 hypothetical protein [Desulfobacterales bacterium]